MKIPKCPYFGTECLKEDCSAFEYVEKDLWDNPNRKGYRHFKKIRKDFLVKNNPQWVAVGIPYCRALSRELPIINEKEEIDLMYFPAEGC